MTPRWTVYCHIHRESGRRYIGLTKLTMMRRWNSHVYTAHRIQDGRLKKSGFGHFPNAIRKYGKDAFDHEILEIFGTLEEANAAEIRWISHFKTCNPRFGFNSAPGGGTAPIQRPYVFTEEHRKKLAESRKGKTVPDLVRDKIAAAQRGKTRDPGSIAKSAASRKGRKLSPELREIAVRNLHKKHSQETLAKIAAANRARPKATHCKHGHSLEDAYVTGGRRFCKPCRLRTCASYHARRRTMAKAA